MVLVLKNGSRNIGKWNYLKMVLETLENGSRNIR